MATDRTTPSYDGQAFRLEDWKMIAKAALIDDYVLAELLRLAPYNEGFTAYAKAVMPFGNPNVVLNPAYALVQPNGATGTVRVMPFRGAVGTRSAVAADPNPQTDPPTYPSLEHVRDIRSAIFAKSSDGTNPGFAVSLAANSSGSPRIDLIYAALVVDQPSTAQTILVKPAIAGQATPQNAQPYLQQSFVSSAGSASILVITGTPDAILPFPPGVPADVPASPAGSGGTYYFPIAWVLVPAGFGAGSTVAKTNIHTIAPVVPFHARATGGVGISPASVATGITGSIVGTFPAATAVYTAWAGGAKPTWMVPTTMQGGRSIFLPIDTANPNFADAAIMDSSIDWRNRFFKWFIYDAANATTPFAWSNGATGASKLPSSDHSLYPAFGAGQSFVIDDGSVGIPGGGGRGAAIAAFVNHSNAANVMPNSANFFALYVDMATGKLKLWNTLAAQTPSFSGRILIEITASEQYDNAG